MQNEQLRKAQIDLEESRDRYFELYDFAPVGYLTIDNNGSIVQANLTVCSLLKIQRNVFLMLPFQNYVDTSQWNIFRDHLNLVAETWSTQTCELRLMRRDRSKVDVQMTTVPIDSPHADDTFWYRSILTDISELKKRDEALEHAYEILDQRVFERTRELAENNERLKQVIRKREHLADSLQVEVEERKKAEIALRKSEELFRRTFDEAPIGAAIISLDDRFQRVNSALCDITGYSQEELRSLTFLDITHPEDRPGNIELARKLAAGELHEYQLEKRYIRKDRKVVWVRVSIKMIRDQSGAPIYYLPMTEDITERKEAEIALKKSEEDYRLLVQNLPGVVYKGRKDWSVEFMDEKTEAFTGYKVEEFYSGRKRWSDLILEEDFTKAKESTIQALKTDKIFTREYRIKKKDGNISWVQDRGTLVCDEKGDILHIHGVFFDVTERRILDDKLVDYQQQLRSLASQLVLTEEQQRRRLAEDLHDSIGQSLALSKLRVDSLIHGEEGCQDSPELESLSTSLGDIIDQTQSMIFQLSPPVLYEVGLGAALDYLAEWIEKTYDIRTTVNLGRDSFSLPEDESVLLFRAVQELLTNTVKHGKASNSSIKLMGSNHQVYIEVRDDGLGFDTSKLEADESFNNKFGLFSIRERLQHLGGHLQIESSPGAGTKVSMTVPLQPEKKQ